MSTKPIIHYLNTDLDLVSSASLQPLAEELDAMGVYCHVISGEEGLQVAIIEVMDDVEPEPNIVQLLAELDRLSEPSKQILRECTKFEFNIGYSCGDEPRCFSQSLSNATLKRVVEYGASLRITLYPYRPDAD